MTGRVSIHQETLHVGGGGGLKEAESILVSIISERLSVIRPALNVKWIPVASSVPSASTGYDNFYPIFFPRSALINKIVIR